MDGMGTPETRETSLDDTAPDAQLEQLERARRLNDQRLKSRFEHIFAKYGHDFSEVGDEIDLRTGEIVVNNGHLERMQHEVDPGTSASSTFLRTFQENLEHESDVDALDSSDNSDVEVNASFEEEDGLSPDTRQVAYTLDSKRGSKEPILKIEDLDDEVNLSPFNTMSRPAPRLAHLLMGQTAERPIDLTDVPNRSSSADSDFADVRRPSSLRTNRNILEQIPDIQNSISALTTRAQSTSSINESTIHALGVSIANQLASLMALGSNGKPRKRRWRRGADPLWDYPEIDPALSRPTKRVRTPDPITDTYPVSPNVNQSLWASRGPGRPRKYDEPAYALPSIDESPSEFDNEDDGSESPETQYDLAERDACSKCGVQSSCAEKIEPDGQKICDFCRGSSRDSGQAQGVETRDSGEGSNQNVVIDAEDENGNGNSTSVYSANTSRRLGAGRKSTYSIGEEALIIKLREQERLPWEKIALQLKDRTACAITFRYNKYLRNQPSEARKLFEAQSRGTQYQPESDQGSSPTTADDITWTDEEDQLLLALRATRGLGWAPIATNFPRHTFQSIQQRYRSIMEAGEPARRHETTQTSESEINARAGSSTEAQFTDAEDALIVHLREVAKLEWCDIPKHTPGRTEFSVRNRYMRELGPEARRIKGFALAQANGKASMQHSDVEVVEDSGPRSKHFRRYRAHEDAMITRLRDVERLDWESIAERLPGRCPTSVRNRYEYMASKVEGHVYPASMSVDPQGPDPNIGNQLAVQQRALDLSRRDHVLRAPAYQNVPVRELGPDGSEDELA